jgi:hypothetical protein
VSSWHSYPSIFNLGHRAVRDLLTVPHVIEEKIDGSQFSFGIFPNDPTSEQWESPLRVRSKGAVTNPDAPEKMFTKAVESVKERLHLLTPGWTYRGEYLAKPKHNTLCYDRVPNGHVILFDVSTGDGEWLGPAEKRSEAERIGLECVPTLNEVKWHDTSDPTHSGVIYPPATLDGLRQIIDTTQSVLGGQLIEGVVIKPLIPLFGVDKKTLLGKFVSERFKEAHRVSWKQDNPTSGDIIQRVADAYRTPARWAKAVQHLRDAGLLTDTPADIAALIKEVRKDVGIEAKEEIQRILWKWAWPHVERQITAGLPEFYKQELMRLQFERAEDAA